MDRIEEARKVLVMIENVNPDDTATLDEIDARAWCLVNGTKITRCFDGIWFHDGIQGREASCGMLDPESMYGDLPQYTRSRDALKGIRLDGWYLTIEQFCDTGFVCEMADLRDNKPLVEFNSEGITETLAELHAIIQSYIYTWENE